MSRKGRPNKARSRFTEVKKHPPGPKCARCGRRRKGMKIHKNLFTDEFEYMHDICHAEQVFRYRREFEEG